MSHGEHEVSVRLNSIIAGFVTWTVGCPVCGPQWIITLNTEQEWFLIGWVNDDYTVAFNFDGTFTINPV
jgi:hypothetical protein